MIRIGTRGSKLALVQANMVKDALMKNGFEAELIIIKSEGDKNQTTALNSFTSPGVFTKALDNAILEKKIDVAVHSCKDLPSQVEPELEIVAVLKRDNPYDVLIARKSTDFLKDKNYKATIATGSVRRKAQWLFEHPNHETVPIRGNIDTRLKKLFESDWDGLIMAGAALNRLELVLENTIELKSFVPSPCQGIIAITANKTDKELIGKLKTINHENTYKLMQVERDFLKQLQIGCSFPVGGMATIKDEEVNFECEMFELEGKDKIHVSKTVKLNDYLSLGKICSEEIIRKGQHLLHET